MTASSKNLLALVTDSSYKPQEKESNLMQIKSETIETLRSKVKEDPKISAVFHVWALRERNRHNMTTRGLYYKMRKEGFMYQQKEYAPIFRLLAELGLAKIQEDKKGNVEAITHFKVPIQQIGQLACGTSVTELATKLPRIVKVPKIEAAPKKVSQVTIPPTVKLASLTVLISGKSVQIQLPEDITPNEAAIIFDKLR